MREIYLDAVGDIFRHGGDNYSCYSVSVCILFHLLVSLMNQVYFKFSCMWHQLLPEFSFHQLPENYHHSIIVSTLSVFLKVILNTETIWCMWQYQVWVISMSSRDIMWHLSSSYLGHLKTCTHYVLNTVILKTMGKGVAMLQIKGKTVICKVFHKGN